MPPRCQVCWVTLEKLRNLEAITLPGCASAFPGRATVGNLETMILLDYMFEITGWKTLGGLEATIMPEHAS